MPRTDVNRSESVQKRECICVILMEQLWRNGIQFIFILCITCFSIIANVQIYLLNDLFSLAVLPFSTDFTSDNHWYKLAGWCGIIVEQTGLVQGNIYFIYLPIYFFFLLCCNGLNCLDVVLKKKKKKKKTFDEWKNMICVDDACEVAFVLLRFFSPIWWMTARVCARVRVNPTRRWSGDPTPSSWAASPSLNIRQQEPTQRWAHRPKRSNRPLKRCLWERRINVKQNDAQCSIAAVGCNSFDPGCRGKETGFYVEISNTFHHSRAESSQASENRHTVAWAWADVPLNIKAWVCRNRIQTKGLQGSSTKF